MKTYTSLEYLKIAVANAAGKDKLNFEDRIDWFDNNIPESVVTMNNKELTDFVLSFDEPDEIETMYTGLLAYQDYWYKRPSGFRASLDAVCSGMSLMSCLTADKQGLDNTGLISHKRSDLYSAVYNTFTKLYKKETDKTRSDVKRAVMCFSYGSSKVPAEVFEEEELPFFYEAMNQECNGAVELRDFIIELWDKNCSEYNWQLPDGYVAHNPVIVERKFTLDIDDTSIDYSLKIQGTKKRSVELAPNLIHSVDSLLVREMIRRCMFDKYQVQLALWSLHKAELELPNSKATPELISDSKLKELIKLYEESKFCSVRIIEHLTTNFTAMLLSSEHRKKLISILELMDKQGNIEVTTVHDSFYTHTSNLNYIRYWYKEMCADIIESNMLPFLLSQLAGESIEDLISKRHRQQVAKLVRNSEYGLC